MHILASQRILVHAGGENLVSATLLIGFAVFFSAEPATSMTLAHVAIIDSVFGWVVRNTIEPTRTLVNGNAVMIVVEGITFWALAALDTLILAIFISLVLSRARLSTSRTTFLINLSCWAFNDAVFRSPIFDQHTSFSTIISVSGENITSSFVRAVSAKLVHARFFNVFDGNRRVAFREKFRVEKSADLLSF